MCIVALVGLELVSTLFHCFRLPSAGVTGMTHRIQQGSFSLKTQNQNQKNKQTYEFT